MLDDILEIEIDGELRRFKQQRIVYKREKSNAFILYELGGSRTFFLKSTPRFLNFEPEYKERLRYLFGDTGFFSFLSRESEKRQKEQETRDEYNLIESLGINIEPIVATHWRGDQLYVVTGNVGEDLVRFYSTCRFNSIRGPNPALMEQGERFFLEICEIMAKLHNNGIAHNHPNARNFTFNGDQVYLIDFSKVEIKSPGFDLHESYFFSFDFAYISSTLASVLGCVEFDGLEDQKDNFITHRVIEGKLRIIDQYEFSAEAKARLARTYTFKEIDSLNELNPDFVAQIPFLEERLDFYRSIDSGFLQGN